MQFQNQFQENHNVIKLKRTCELVVALVLMGGIGRVRHCEMTD